MKKYFVIAVLAGLLSSVAFGNDDISGILLNNLYSHKISLSYSCTVKLDVPMKSEGKLTAQKNCYRLSTAGMDIYCNGVSRWTVDSTAREVYIESAPGVQEFLDDIQGYLSRLDDVNLSDVTIGPPDTGTADFVFDEKALDSSWIVTDLR